MTALYLLVIWGIVVAIDVVILRYIVRRSD